MNDSRFYVYPYYDLSENGLPFYIGKGCGTRSLTHFDLCFNSDTMFHRKLSKMIRGKNQIIVEKLHTKLMNTEAMALEVALIKKYGRRDLGTGCLCNHTDGGEGQSGRIMSFETREKISETKRAQMREATIDERIAISRAQVGHKESVVTRTRKRESRVDCVAVCSYDLRTGETIKTYPSVNSVKLDRFTPENVHKVIRRERPHHGSLGWRMV